MAKGLVIVLLLVNKTVAFFNIHPSASGVRRAGGYTYVPTSTRCGVFADDDDGNEVNRFSSRRVATL